jgi:hypothetical protein
VGHSWEAKPKGGRSCRSKEDASCEKLKPVSFEGQKGGLRLENTSFGTDRPIPPCLSLVRPDSPNPKAKQDLNSRACRMWIA